MDSTSSQENMDFVNKKAFEGTLLAHTDGGVPNLIVNVPALMVLFWKSGILL